MTTKEDVYKAKQELQTQITELRTEIYNVKEELQTQITKLEKDILVIKLLLWIVVILSGLSSFPQLLNLLKLIKTP